MQTNVNGVGGTSMVNSGNASFMTPMEEAKIGELSAQYETAVTKITAAHRIWEATAEVQELKKQTMEARRRLNKALLDVTKRLGLDPKKLRYDMKRKRFVTLGDGEETNGN